MKSAVTRRKSAHLDLSDETLSRAAAKALEAALEQTAQDARSRCPVKSGSLRASIGVCISQQGARATGEVYAAAPHAKAVELGTMHSPAQPFLYPAYRENAARIQDAIREQSVRALKAGLEGEMI